MQLVPQSWGSPLREFNKCHSPQDGRFCSDPSDLAVFKTNEPGKLRVHRGWATDPDQHLYLTDPDRYKAEVGAKGDPKTTWGWKALKGKPVTADELLKAGKSVLFHVTTDLDGVIASGELSAFESGGPDARPGLGGGGHPAVSFTTDRKSALNIMRTIGVMRDLAKGAPFEKTIRAFAARELAQVIERYGGDRDNVPFFILNKIQDGLDEAIRNYQTNYKAISKLTGTRTDFESRTSAAVDGFNQFLWYRDSAELGKNPIFFTRAPQLRRIKRLGIVAVPVRDIPKATLMNYGADAFQGEIEVHGDVPVRGASFTTASLLRRRAPRRRVDPKVRSWAKGWTGPGRRAAAAEWASKQS